MSGHVFRNAFVPLVQYLPTSFLITLMGSIYVESLYSVPGMGGLLVDVIQRQDNTVVQALVLIYAAISILGLLIGDILMAVVDPRISLNEKRRARGNGIVQAKKSVQLSNSLNQATAQALDGLSAADEKELFAFAEYHPEDAEKIRVFRLFLLAEHTACVHAQ